MTAAPKGKSKSSTQTALTGRRIAITRSREGNSELAALLAERGAEVLELPLIRVSKEVSKETLADVLLELGGYDWLVFTSANGVRYFFEEFNRIFDDIRALGLVRIACVGEATARSIRDLHLRVECQPKTATAEALADEIIATGSLDSAKVLVITGNLNRETLTRKLEEARAIVDQLQVYKTEMNDLSQDPAAREFRARGADAILFASSSAVRAYVQQRPHLKPDRGANAPLHGSIGPQTREALEEAGLSVDFEAKTPGLEPLVKALIERLGRK